MRNVRVARGSRLASQERWYGLPSRPVVKRRKRSRVQSSVLLQRLGKSRERSSAVESRPPVVVPYQRWF